MSLSRWDCNGFLAGTFLFIMQVFLGNWGFCWAGARQAAGDYRSSKVFWLFSRHLVCQCRFPPGSQAFAPPTTAGRTRHVLSAYPLLLGSALAPLRRAVPGSSYLWWPAVVLFSRELLLPSSPLINPLPWAGSILGKISARREAPELFSREYRGRLQFAGCGTATTGTSAVAAAGAVVPRCSRESASSGEGAARTWRAQPWAPERAPALSRAHPRRGGASSRCGWQGPRARESSGSRHSHLRGPPAQGPPPVRPGDEVGEAGAGAGGAPQGHLLAPRPPLEDVSGEAHVLPAGAEQDNLGGARALPKPVPGGLRRLWLRVVSVTGLGASVGWVTLYAPEPGLPPRLSNAPSGRNFPWGRASLPLRPLSFSPCTPCTPHPAHPHRWSAVCRTQVHDGRWVMVLEPGPGSHPAHSLLGGLLLWGQEQEGPLWGSPSWHRAEGLSPEMCPPWAPEPALGADKPGELPGETEGQSSTGRLPSSEQNWGRRAFSAGFFANLCRNPILRSVLFEFALELVAIHRA